MTVLAWMVVGVLSVMLASSMYFHLSSRLRFKLLRQLTDYSNLLAPYNAFVCLSSAVPRRPVLDVGTFPELRILREHWREIRDEALALLAEGDIRDTGGRDDDLVFYSFMKRGWKRFYLHWYGPPLRSARESCPRTLALLDRIPTVHGAMFALLPPGSRLGKHRDPFAGCLRYHLGLLTPNSEDCRLFIDDREYIWRDGEDVLLDTSFVHKARNRTETPRLILFCDVERPLRNRLATAINRFTIRHLVPGTATPNEPGDRTGFANRVFSWVAPIRHPIARFKQAAPVAYYVLKVALPLGLLALLLTAGNG